MFRRFSRLNTLAIAVLLLAIPLTLSAEPLKQSLFEETTKAMAAAKDARADLLAPTSYGKALEHYNKAEKKFDKGESIEGIRDELRQATDYLKQAVEATKVAEVTLTATIEARDDAIETSASQYSAKTWAKAEKKFREASTELENGDVSDAREKGDEATARYREAELASIKSYFFQDTRHLLQQADDNDVKKYAPKCLTRSMTLLKEAEAALNQNRYDTDRPRTLAREALYEANHAIYVADLISNMDERKMTTEDLILASESPLRRIAASIDVPAQFDTGYENTTIAILGYMATEQMRNESLTQGISDGKQSMVLLEQHIAVLEDKLGGAKDEQNVLLGRIHAQEDVRKQFEQIEAMFDKSQARVLREGDTVIIRLTGMNFDVGQSTVRSEHFALASKVQDAIRVFPGADVRIEGHTDSFGTDEANLELSQERAEAVRLYLLANIGTPAPTITSFGYGETHPIANNDTKDGRAANRRIDVVILPQV